MDEIEVKIKQLEKQYPDDPETIKEWRDLLRQSFEDEKFLEIGAVKQLVNHLRVRIKTIRIRLSSPPALEKADALALHARLDELASLLALLAKDPKKQRKQLEAEIDAEMQNA